MSGELESSCFSSHGRAGRSVWRVLRRIGLGRIGLDRIGLGSAGLCGVVLYAAAGCSGGGSDPRGQSGVPDTAVASGGGAAETASGAGAGEPSVGAEGAETPDSEVAVPATPADASDSGEASAGPDDSPAGSEGGSAEEDVSFANAEPFTQLRLLTQSEYRRSIEFLLGEGTDVASLQLPADRVDGFATVGGLLAVVGVAHAADYEAASQAAVSALFDDTERWSALVGCQPQPDLADACVETFVRTFGRRAFRRDLEDAEAARWVALARNAAVLTDDADVSAATGLAAATAGMLQSPKFLYRVEHASPDTELQRIRFDGSSMATRLAFLTTGSTPDDALLDSAIAGELDTEQGVRAAFERLSSLARAKDFPAEFFIELTKLDAVLGVERPVDDLSDTLRASMFEEAQRWLGEVVLAPRADVRSFFDSRATFVDGPLAEFYGVPAPGDGFQEIELDPSTGRAGILGKAGFLLAHSSSASSNPARRGHFILTSLMCRTVSPPPAGLVVTIPEPEAGDAPMTTRQLFEGQHRSDPSCAACHVIIDPPGFALEHFDANGRYRETENGLPIDASGEFAGGTFEDAIGLGELLRNSAEASACFVKNFYRYANGTSDVQADEESLAELTTAFADRGYVWREWIADFAASTAFNSVSPLHRVSDIADLDPAESTESADSAQE